MNSSKSQSNLTQFESGLKNLSILNIVVTGAIGVGKSTVINYLKQSLDKTHNIHCSIVNEYIVEKYNNIPIGETMLNMFMQNKLSSFTFQNYIIDWWDKQYKWLDSIYNTVLVNQPEYDLSVRIFERLPYDNINCFAKYALLTNNLTQQEFDSLTNRCQNVLGQYQPIDYSKSSNVVLVNNDSRITAENIYKDIIFYLGKLNQLNSTDKLNITQLESCSKNLTQQNQTTNSLTRAYNLLSSNHFNIVRANIDSRQRESDNLYTNDDLGYIVNYYNTLF